MTNTIKFYIPKSWLGVIVIVFSRSSLLNMGTFLVSTEVLVLIQTALSNLQPLVPGATEYRHDRGHMVYLSQYRFL